MKLRYTIIASLIMVALASYVYFVEMKGQEAQEELEQEESKVFDLQWDQVNEVVIQRYLERVVLSKQDDQWTLTEPVQDIADKYTVESMLRSLEYLESNRTLTDVADKLSEFMLQKPPVKVTVKTLAKEETLYVGLENEVGGTYFARFSNSTDVMVLPASVYANLHKEVLALRNKKVFLGLKREDVRGIEVYQGANRLFGINRENDQWNVVHPQTLAGDEDRINRLLTTVLNLSATAFHYEKAENLSRFSLDPPLTSVIVTDREKAWPALLMGTTVGDEEKVYAKREDRDPVFVIPKSVVQNLTPSLFELREKRLAAVEKDKVVKIELKWPDSSVILTKKEGEWISLSHQVEGKADMFKVEDAISSIVDTKAKEFFEGVDNLQEYGFTEPSCVVTLYGEEGEKLVHLVLGADAGQDRIFVKRTGDGLTASVEKSFLENLPRTADQVLIPVEDNNSEAQVEDGETGDAVEGRASN